MSLVLGDNFGGGLIFGVGLVLSRIRSHRVQFLYWLDETLACVRLQRRFCCRGVICRSIHSLLAATIDAGSISDNFVCFVGKLFYGSRNILLWGAFG